MTRELLLARRDYFNMVHGVTLRAIAALADQDLDFRPRARLRTPRQLIFHIYAQEKLIAEAARSIDHVNEDLGLEGLRLLYERRVP